MKWKTYKRLRKINQRPFLVLSFTENFDVDAEIMPKKPALRLFTKTWALKTKDDKNNENARPLTATLDKPQILDISLIAKIDMSLIRKEFLSITNLCRIPLTAINVSKAKRKPLVFNQRRCASNRPPSLPSNVPPKKSSRRVASDDSWEDEETNLSLSKSPRKIGKLSKMNAKVKSAAPKQVKKLDNDANNNSKTYRITRKLTSPNNTIDDKLAKLPEPCKTCGRPEQPERFHSHPVATAKSTKKMEENVKIPVKNTVQKPVAIKYKSKLTDKASKNHASVKKQIPSPKTVHTLPSVKTSNETTASRPKTGKGPKTLTCYICGREFGTMSLPLHEPKCLEKWERENDSLPANLRRKIPVKPDRPLSKDEWNTFAWESAQANLVPCGNCKRTFYPDRLLVHQRSCKSTNSTTMANNPIEDASVSSTPSTPSKPRHVSCSVCGRMFGTKSIKIHEPQCLKKWHLQNDNLPPKQREQLHKQTVETTKKSPTPAQKPELEDKPKSPKKPPMFPCYLCGRLFSVNSIYIHEPQCLKKWQVENDKLPPSKRRQEPLKPDIKFTHDGKVDHKSIIESNWSSHLSQLVPCKLCGRTFNPDRVEVHERSCKI